MRDQLGDGLPGFLGRLRERTSLPLAVGFGVSTPEQAGVVAALADGVIIGSRLVRLVQEAPDLDTGLDEIDAYLRAVREAMKSAAR